MVLQLVLDADELLHPLAGRLTGFVLSDYYIDISCSELMIRVAFQTQKTLFALVFLTSVLLIFPPFPPQWSLSLCVLWWWCSFFCQMYSTNDVLLPVDISSVSLTTRIKANHCSSQGSQLASDFDDFVHQQPAWCLPKLWKLKSM